MNLFNIFLEHLLFACRSVVDSNEWYDLPSEELMNDELVVNAMEEKRVEESHGGEMKI